MVTLRPFLMCVLFMSLAACKGRKETPAPPQQEAADTLTRYSIPRPDSIFVNALALSMHVAGPVLADMDAFYRNRQHKCAWFDEYGLTEQAGKVVNMVRDYIESGAYPVEGLLPGVVGLLDTVSDEQFSPPGNDTLLLRADVLFTAQFLMFSETVWKGKGEQARKLDWFLPVKKFSELQYLEKVLTDDTARVIGNEPVYRQYHLLRAKMKLFADIQKTGGWTEVPLPGKQIAAGDSSQVVTEIRKRLARTGDFAGDTLSPIYDTLLTTAITQMRTSYGMDGNAIDDRFVRELNIPVAQRLRTMELNLERWKWIPPDPGNRFLAVNIPEFMLHVFEDGKSVKDMRVIVGKSVNQTVIFSGDLKNIVFSPYWIVPRSIIIKETLPAVKRDRSYLQKHRMEVFTQASPPKVMNPAAIKFSTYNGNSFPYGIRQKPGPGNSLGKVKFLFPNNYSIYLHDTPSRNLFGREERSFSHGCIRLAEPAWLAEYLLRAESDWPKQKIEKSMNADTETWVHLRKPIPVYITYFTSWVDGNGRLNFRNDLYGHDQKLARVLFDN